MEPPALLSVSNTPKFPIYEEHRIACGRMSQPVYKRSNPVPTFHSRRTGQPAIPPRGWSCCPEMAIMSSLSRSARGLHDLASSGRARLAGEDGRRPVVAMRFAVLPGVTGQQGEMRMWGRAKYVADVGCTSVGSLRYGPAGPEATAKGMVERSLQSNFPEELTRHHRARRISRPNVDSRREAQHLAENTV